MTVNWTSILSLGAHWIWESPTQLDLDLDLEIEAVQGNIFLTKAQNVVDGSDTYISYTMELWLESDGMFCVLRVFRRYTDFEVFYDHLVKILPQNVFIIPKLPAKIINFTTDGIMQRMQDLQAFMNAVFEHPVLRNLKLTNDFLTFGALKEDARHCVITREITLDSEISAPDNEWFHDQKEKIPVLGFINEYYKSGNTLTSIGEKLCIKENLFYDMCKSVGVMDNSLKEFGKSIKIFGDQLSNLENADLDIYTGMPLKRIGLRLKRINDFCKKKSSNLYKSLESLGNIVPSARPLITNLNQDPVIFQIIHSSLYYFDEYLNMRVAKSLQGWIDDSVDVFQSVTTQLKEIQDILRKSL